jgi:hypothetical protein
VCVEEIDKSEAFVYPLSTKPNRFGESNNRSFKEVRMEIPTGGITQTEMGTIALAMLRQQMRREGLRLKPGHVHRHVGHIAKVAGVTREKASAFANVLIAEMVAAAMAPSQRPRK